MAFKERKNLQIILVFQSSEKTYKFTGLSDIMIIARDILHGFKERKNSQIKLTNFTVLSVNSLLLIEAPGMVDYCKSSIDYKIVTTYILSFITGQK